MHVNMDVNEWQDINHLVQSMITKIKGKYKETLAKSGNVTRPVDYAY